MISKGVYREARLFQYVICGLSIDSEIALPGVQETFGRASLPDAIVRRGIVPFDGAGVEGLNWQVEGDRFLLRIPDIARYLIVDGREILMETEGTASEADALPFLLGTGIGALLHQRGCLVLHAATVSFGGRAVALCGRSGIGKSTLAAALCRAGCDFVSDDLTAVRFDADGRPFSSPDGRQHRLWEDTVAHLSLADRQGAPIRPHLRKFHVDPSGGVVLANLPLAAVAILSSSLPTNGRIVPLNLADAASLLRREVYRPALAVRMGRDVPIFGQIAALLNHAHVFRLHRDDGFDRVDETVRAVMAYLRDTA